jgi:hypothetical protein
VGSLQSAAAEKWILHKSHIRVNKKNIFWFYIQKINNPDQDHAAATQIDILTGIAPSKD